MTCAICGGELRHATAQDVRCKTCWSLFQRGEARLVRIVAATPDPINPRNGLRRLGWACTSPPTETSVISRP